MRLSVFALLLSLFSSFAFAQSDADRDQARAAFGRGVEAFSGENYQEALEAFQEAYRIAPHPSVRVNMANCYEGLNRPIEAIFHFERFLVEAEGPNPAQVAEVRSAIERLQGQVGEVFIRVSPDGARVTIDDHDSQRAPILDAVRLVAGRHRIAVEADGYQGELRTIEVEGGSRTEIRVDLSEEGAVAVAATDVSPEQALGDPSNPEVVINDGRIQEEEPEAEEGDLNVPAIIAGAGAAVLTATTIAVGVLALQANSDFDDAVVRSNDPALSDAERLQARQDGFDAQDRANRRALATDILAVGALAAAGVTAYFLLTADDDDATANRLTGGAVVTAEGAALSLGGTF